MVSRPSSWSPPAAPAPVPSVPGWQGAVDQELAAAGNSSEPGSRTYRDGLIDMKAGKYANAVGKFQAFQRAHPKSPLAEPAEYFSANALFEMGARDPSNYNQSILQFNDLAMRYPRGRFAASAQLREAQAFLRTNDSLDARLTLQKLVRDHPGTPEAAAADAMMKSMASSAPDAANSKPRVTIQRSNTVAWKKMPSMASRNKLRNEYALRPTVRFSCSYSTVPVLKPSHRRMKR